MIVNINEVEEENKIIDVTKTIIDDVMKSKEEQKEYYKNYRVEHKKLVKFAKSFKPWDYGFMEDVLFQMIKMMYEYHKNPDNVHYDINCEVNKYKDIISSLEKCVDLIENKLENEEVSFDEEKENNVKKEIYETIKNNFMLWWD